MVPKYVQIKEYLKAEALKPEAITSMPSVRTLMRRFSVAMATVNQALIELEHENVIIRQQGRGIVAARMPQNPEVPDAAQNAASIFFAYPDYPSEQLWRLEFMTEQYAKQSGFQVISYKMQPDTTVRAITEAAARYPNCREILIIPTPDRYSHEELEILGRQSVPVVLLDSQSYYEDMPENLYIVSHEPELSGRLMAECLLQHGHERVGYVRNEPQSDYGIRKENAFVKTLRWNGAVIPASHIFSETIRPWENSLNAARQITAKNLDNIRKQKLSALVYTSGVGAVAAIPILVEGGFAVPDDISLISEGESTWLEYSNPPLSAVRPHYDGMCKRATEIAEGKFLDEHFFFCEQEIIERKSIKTIQNNKSIKKGKSQ